MTNDAIYNKLLDIENRLTTIEECHKSHLQYHESEGKRKSKRSEFWEKVLIGGIGAGFAFGFTGIKTLIGWK